MGGRWAWHCWRFRNRGREKRAYELWRCGIDTTSRLSGVRIYLGYLESARLILLSLNLTRSPRLFLSAANRIPSVMASAIPRFYRFFCSVIHRQPYLRAGPLKR